MGAGCLGLFVDTDIGVVVYLEEEAESKDFFGMPDALVILDKSKGMGRFVVVRTFGFTLAFRTTFDVVVVVVVVVVLDVRFEVFVLTDSGLL